VKEVEAQAPYFSEVASLSFQNSDLKESLFQELDGAFKPEHTIPFVVYKLFKIDPVNDPAP
jgi:hypothetical protein